LSNKPRAAKEQNAAQPEVFKTCNSKIHKLDSRFRSQIFENSDSGSNKQFKADRTLLLIPC
jgi:hypothetical protein